MNVTRWEEKLFNVLIDPIKETIDERNIESTLNYYYQRLDTQDIVVSGGIGDVENNYKLLADLEMHALLSIYGAKGKDFDQVFKRDMKDLGFYCFLRIMFLHNWKFREILSQTALQMTKRNDSGQHIEPFQTAIAQNFVIFSCNRFKIINLFIRILIVRHRHYYSVYCLTSDTFGSLR